MALVTFDVYTSRELGLDNCPTPHKKAYPSKAKANRLRRLLKNKPRHRNVFLEPYQCRCGYWHLATDHHKTEARNHD